MTTLFIDPALCTRCGICRIVCPMKIIGHVDENTLPDVPEAKAGMCIRCGHCEVSCPSRAVTLNFLPDEKVTIPAGAGSLSPYDLSVYLKNRRSVRHYTPEPLDKDTIQQILDVARYAASGSNGQPVRWLVVHDPEESPETCRADYRMDENTSEQRSPYKRVRTFPHCGLGTGL